MLQTEKLNEYRQQAKDAGGKGWAWTCMILCDELEVIQNDYETSTQIIQDLRSQVSRLEDEVVVRRAGFLDHHGKDGSIQWQPPNPIHGGMRFSLGAAAKLARSMDV